MDELIVQFSTAAPTAWFDHWIKDRSRCICRMSHAKFSHGDYVTARRTLIGSSDNPTAPVLRGNPRGVAERPFDYQEFLVRNWARIPCTLWQKEHYEVFLEAQLGKPFDAEALKFKTFLNSDMSNRDWRDPSKWFCHEMLVRGYEEIGLLQRPLINVKNRITAGDHLLIINHLIDPEDFWTYRMVEMSDWERRPYEPSGAIIDRLAAVTLGVT